jgi:hypothetical protein
MSALDALADYAIGAVLCPHPEARRRHTMYVRAPEGGPAMGLCASCTGMFRELATPGIRREQVFARMLAAGYPRADAADYWRQIRRERRRQRWAAVLVLLTRWEMTA